MRNSVVGAVTLALLFCGACSKTIEGIRWDIDVSVEQAVEDDGGRAITEWASRIGDSVTRSLRVSTAAAGDVRIEGLAEEHWPAALAAIGQAAPGWRAERDGAALHLTIGDARRRDLRARALAQTVHVLEARLHDFGVPAFAVRPDDAGRDRVIVELDPLGDAARLKKIVQTRGHLELRLAYYGPDGSGPFIDAAAEHVASRFGGRAPLGIEILPFEETDQAGQRRVLYYMAVERRAVIDGRDIAKAMAAREPTAGQPVVEFELDSAKGAEFAMFTRNHIGRQMPIVLDGRILTAPIINSEIGSRGMIEGGFTRESAADLATNLRAGALPVRTTVVSESTAPIRRSGLSRIVRAFSR